MRHQPAVCPVMFPKQLCCGAVAFAGRIADRTSDVLIGMTHRNLPHRQMQQRHCDLLCTALTRFRKAAAVVVVQWHNQSSLKPAVRRQREHIRSHIFMTIARLIWPIFLPLSVQSCLDIAAPCAYHIMWRPCSNFSLLQRITTVVNTSRLGPWRLS